MMREADLKEVSLTHEPGRAAGLLSPRSLLWLGGAAASVLVVGVVLLARHSASSGPGSPTSVLVLLWVLVIVASLLLLGAVSGLLARLATRAQVAVPDWRASHDQQVVAARLRRGEEVPPELREAAQHVVDRLWRSLGIWLVPVLGVTWLGMATASQGRDLWFRLAIGAGYCALAVQRLRERRRVLRAAARSGIHPRRRRTRRGAR